MLVNARLEDLLDWEGLGARISGEYLNNLADYIFLFSNDRDYLQQWVNTSADKV